MYLLTYACSHVNLLRKWPFPLSLCQYILFNLIVCIYCIHHTVFHKNLFISRFSLIFHLTVHSTVLYKDTFSQVYLAQWANSPHPPIPPFPILQYHPLPPHLLNPLVPFNSFPYTFMVYVYIHDFIHTYKFSNNEWYLSLSDLFNLLIYSSTLASNFLLSI